MRKLIDELQKEQLFHASLELKRIIEKLEEYATQQSKVVSDEDIRIILKSLAEQRATPSFQDGFHQGAKWMREQLTKKD